MTAGTQSPRGAEPVRLGGRQGLLVWDGGDPVMGPESMSAPESGTLFCRQRSI